MLWCSLSVYVVLWMQCSSALPIAGSVLSLFLSFSLLSSGPANQRDEYLIHVCGSSCTSQTVEQENPSPSHSLLLPLFSFTTIPRSIRYERINHASMHVRVGEWDTLYGLERKKDGKWLHVFQRSNSFLFFSFFFQKKLFFWVCENAYLDSVGRFVAHGYGLCIYTGKHDTGLPE